MQIELRPLRIPPLMRLLLMRGHDEIFARPRSQVTDNGRLDVNARLHDSKPWTLYTLTMPQAQQDDSRHSFPERAGHTRPPAHSPLSPRTHDPRNSPASDSS